MGAVTTQPPSLTFIGKDACELRRMQNLRRNGAAPQEKSMAEYGLPERVSNTLDRTWII